MQWKRGGGGLLWTQPGTRPLFLHPRLPLHPGQRPLYPTVSTPNRFVNPSDRVFTATNHWLCHPAPPCIPSASDVCTKSVENIPP